MRYFNIYKPLYLLAILSFYFFLAKKYLQIDHIDPKTHDFINLITWGVAAVLLTSAMTWSACNSIRSIISLCTPKLRSIIALSVSLLIVFAQHFGDMSGSAGHDVVKIIAEKYKFIHADFNNVIHYLNTAAASVGFLVFINITVLNYHLHNDPGYDIAKIESLFSVSFFASSVFLVAGLLEIFALYKWGASIENNLKVISYFIPIGAGLLFSCLLAALYGPSIVQLHKKIDASSTHQRRYANSSYFIEGIAPLFVGIITFLGEKVIDKLIA